ncbi:MAG: TonB-dependent receptor plug domain-containing protein [Chitinophagaceae bacterium]
MKRILFICIALLCTVQAYTQYSIRLSVQKKEDRFPLSGATAIIDSLNKKAIADSAGLIIFNNVPAGNYRILISYVALQPATINVQIPFADDSAVQVLLEEAEEDEEEVVVTATRTSRSIKDLPTRVETISGEELAEKANMKPGDIRMLLNESTGIQTQQTSATSYSSSIRIQGLDGRYTQVLRDGFPLYAGFSGGLSLMQVPPLDLKQVEVIKGSSSTLYGGGAIAGLVNLVSKTPGEKKGIKFHRKCYFCKRS